MNKLRFNLKFALIILLFLLPLAMLAVSYFTPVMRQLTHTENELRGLKAITLVDQQQKALINLIADDMGWRSGTVIPPEQAAKVATFNKQLQNLLDSDLFGEQQKEVLAQAIKKVTGSLSATTSSIGNPQWTPIDRFNLLQASSSQFNNLYLTVANLTGLTNDQEIDTVLLSRLLTEKREFVLDLVSRSYGIVSYAVGENEVSSNTFDSISLTSDRLAASINDIGNLSSLTERMDEGLQDLVKQDVKVLRRLINDNLTFLEEQFLLAEEVNLNQSQVKDFYRQQINDFYQSKQSLSDELERRLNFRVQTMQNSILSVILIVAAVVLVVVYLFVGMSLSISMTTMSLANVAQKLANGDTRAKANVRTKDEFSVAIKAFNQMAKNVNSLVESVQNASKGVAQQSDSVKQLANQTGDAVNEQLQDTQAITSAIGDLLASVAVISENSVHVMQSLEKANQQTLEGRQTLDGARRATNELGDEIKLSVEVIHQLSQQSDSINQVLDVIKSIAEQTNLLALNAAIEAARAGDQGRGFAVVADEVRSLAKRTHDSTEEIQSTISSLQQGVGNAVEAMTRSDQKALRSIEEAAKLEAALDQITQAVEEIGEQNAATEQASQQQTEVAGQIEGRLNSISQISTVTENNVQQSISASQQLAEYVDRLEAVVANFKT